MNRRHFVVALALLAIVACDVALGPGVYDFSAPLSGDYYLHRNSSHQIFVAPMEWGNETPIIPAKVVELDHDEMWVIAKQQQLRDRSSEDLSEEYQVSAPEEYSYWILRTQAPKLWGPFAETEFSEKRLTLEVPSELLLHDVYDYACGVNKDYKCRDLSHRP